MAVIDTLRSITPEVSGILKKAGYFEEDAKDLREDTATKQKLKEAIDAKNHKLIEEMWSENPDFLASMPQFQGLKDHLTKTDLDRIVKEASGDGITQRKFEKRIDESYLTSPSRIERIERTEGHITDLMKAQREARKEKYKFKIWRTRSGECPLCRALEGQRRKIGEPYSTGGYTAHRHPNCLCYDEYE